VTASTDLPIELLLLNVDRAFDKRSFHGTTLRGALRGLSPDVAGWKAGPERNSIWALILHAAYWKYIVRRSLTEDADASFPRSPSNFPHVPSDVSRPALKRDIQLLVNEHRLLREAVAAAPVATLQNRVRDKSPTRLGLILGIAAHDLYHTGQIQLLKRLHAERDAV